MIQLQFMAYLLLILFLVSWISKHSLCNQNAGVKLAWNTKNLQSFVHFEFSITADYIFWTAKFVTDTSSLRIKFVGALYPVIISGFSSDIRSYSIC